MDSHIGDLMENPNPTVGLAAHPGQTDVRIVAKAVSEREADRLIADMERQVRTRLGNVIYGVEKETVAEVVARTLRSHGLQLGLIECGTEGLVNEAFLMTPDGPEALGDSLVVAGPEEAAEALGLGAQRQCNEDLFSPETAQRAAHAGRERLGVDLCLAVWAPASIADEPSDRQPMYIALDTGSDASVGTYRYGGHSDRARGWLVNRALDMVRQSLL